MKTVMANSETIERKWFVVDAEGQTLGRFASEVAKILKGKHKPEYTPHVDCGDYVIVLNCGKIKVTGNKATQKVYRHHTGWVGNLKEVPYQEMLKKHPDRIITHAVKGMLPKNSLGRQMIKKLKVYTGSEHSHDAQKPEVLEIKA
ncbi:MAG: 50S ribosomal protein L13 [Clostridiales bacterium]|nr:50S ribosomal protein L13 [Clostridiales bacterium]